MRKLLIILFLAPLLMAIQCVSDEIVVSTVYIIQNDSNTNLIFITEEAGETVIASQSSHIFNFGPNASTVVSPAENSNIISIQLFKLDFDQNQVLAYEQNPILDELWSLNELSSLEYEYSLIITDDLID